MIKKEDFNKLSQLDRIEYRQRREGIEKDAIGFGAGDFLDRMLILIGFMILVAINLYSICIDMFIRVMMIIPFIMKITIIIWLVLFGAGVIQLFNTKKKIKQLNEEYFSEVITIKKK